MIDAGMQWYAISLVAALVCALSLAVNDHTHRLKALEGIAPVTSVTEQDKP